MNRLNLSKVPGRVVLVVYPYTGVPGIPDPEGWDDIPGAHGSTPQCLAFSYRYAEFSKLNVKVFGLSLQASVWQDEFVKRTQLMFPLLADAGGKFSSELRLDRFKAGGIDFLTRRTLIIDDGIITHDVYPVLKPAANADQMLQLVTS